MELRVFHNGVGAVTARHPHCKEKTQAGSAVCHSMGIVRDPLAFGGLRWRVACTDMPPEVASGFIVDGPVTMLGWVAIVDSKLVIRYNNQ